MSCVEGTVGLRSEYKVLLEATGCVDSTSSVVGGAKVPEKIGR